jgi:hypothetical protein
MLTATAPRPDQESNKSGAHKKLRLELDQLGRQEGKPRLFT